MRTWLSIYLKGVSMGAADSIPGVSGGTIALITGIYERLISAIAAFEPTIVADLVRIYDPEARTAVRDMLVEMDLPFLVALAAGIFTAVVGMTRVMEFALTEYTALTFAFFFGLIAASAVVLYKHVSVSTPRRLAVAIFGFVFAYLLTGATSAGLPHTIPFVFVAGAIAISAMLLPGISGAFLLVIMGQYEFMIGSLKTFVDALAALATGGGLAPVVRSGVPVVTFLVGVAVGVVTIARVITWALSNYRAATLTFLVSLMLGALRLPVAKVLSSTPTWNVLDVVGLVAVAVVGGALVLVLDYYTDDLDYDDDVASPVPGNAD